MIKTVVISASASQKSAIENWVKYFKDKDYKVINHPIQIENKNFANVYPKIHKKFYNSLSKTDIHFISNEDKNGVVGYIGTGTFAELSFTVGLNFIRKKKIKIIVQKIPDKKSNYYEDIKSWEKLGWINFLCKK
jgi:hypothetical protein